MMKLGLAGDLKAAEGWKVGTSVSSASRFSSSSRTSFLTSCLPSFCSWVSVFLAFFSGPALFPIKESLSENILNCFKLALPARENAFLLDILSSLFILANYIILFKSVHFLSTNHNANYLFPGLLFYV